MPTSTKKSIDLLAPVSKTNPQKVVPLWSKGFRPLFALAALHAVLFLPIWLLAYSGRIDIGSYWIPSVWHGHEMVYGFVLAVIGGFLLTAVGNWTGQETAIGRPLMGLCLLWLVGRLGVLASSVVPGWLVAVLDLLYVPALAVAIGRPLIRTKNKRNLMFLVILTAFWATNLCMHLDALGVLEHVASRALMFSVDLTLIVTLIIGGRIIPLFTRNATNQAKIRKSPFFDRAAIFLMVVVMVASATAAAPAITGTVAVLGGLVVLLRMRSWGSIHTVRHPILWVLHLGHAWIGIGLLLRGAATFGLGIALTFAVHVLTIGGIGTLIIGMITRVARGHTGRALNVTRLTTFAYVLISFAVFSRALIPMIVPDMIWTGYIASGVAWSVAFLIYLWRYLPILVAPRADA